MHVRLVDVVLHLGRRAFGKLHLLARILSILPCRHLCRHLMAARQQIIHECSNQAAGLLETLTLILPQRQFPQGSAILHDCDGDLAVPRRSILPESLTVAHTSSSHLQTVGLQVHQILTLGAQYWSRYIWVQSYQLTIRKQYN